MPQHINVAMVGHGFMGAAHSQAFRVAPRFFDLPLTPVMSTLVGRNASATTAAAEKWGWEKTANDWHDVVNDPDIGLIDISSPGSTHVEIAVAALEAGKHVLCEKPLANTVEEAETMAAAAAAAAERGVYAMVGFSYRRVPALTFAKQLVAEGRLGTIRQVRAQYLQDWLVDEDGPMTWRLDKAKAGSGALGDIGAHAIDAVQFITGQMLDDVSGLLHTFVTERPLLDESVAQTSLGGAASTERGQVTVDDLALFTAKLSGGAIGSFEATRFATGRKNAFRIEIAGSLGALSFDLERENELEFYDATAPATELGFKRILVTEPEHPYFAAWWPTGHTIGYEHAFSHQLVDLLTSIDARTQPTPSFEDGLQVQRVLDAVDRSSEAGSAWTTTRATATANGETR
ncbi:putative dehydrogenase [Frondihabitans sp. PhB188]|uniref:Gfo/Idh/MocA family protein n=1 Tax=Frondihabitans sp. PhB188 TaxID=2485200 RepID=UPI000FA4811E|nr:Gfo/Idh/MocA family oxidoreductase [Frondihabitans sp. PhB188]ROQ41500.1 putative dehydrogenase [Frondihabitans sp. PhB188]